MKKYKINYITLGCSKNWVDTEVLMRQFEKEKFSLFHNSYEKNFDTVIINTCGFIADAKEESINVILENIEKKANKEIKNLVVFGCLSERYKEELEKEMPEVDAFFGVKNFKELLEYLKEIYKQEILYKRIITTPSHFAYLKISEGCNRKCSFCIIPLIRGKHISKSIENLVKEANYLSKKGVKELILIAQDLSYYGLDLYKKPKLAELIEKLSEVKGIEWIRLHYLYPFKFPKNVLEVIKKTPNICNYLDIPVQHISDDILKNMKRGHSKKDLYDLLYFFKKQNPEIALRTTLIVGFPNESEEDFEELKNFIKKIRFDRLGVFSYSKEENTFSEKNFIDNIPEEIKEKRKSEIMEIQQKISFELNEEKIGKYLKIIVEKEEKKFFIGRTEFDSPEVDNEVMVKKDINKKIKIGNFYKVKIIDAEDFDLFAEFC